MLSYSSVRSDLAYHPAGPDGGLIGPEDPPPFTIYNAEGAAPILLVCDHASRTIPHRLNQLGLEPWAHERHIVYDIGAAAVTKGLADRLGASAVLAGYSRLLIDCNRQPGDPHSILEVSDGIPIPGNRDLTSGQQEARAEAFHWPYHHAIDHVFARLRRGGPEPVLFSIHSFTPTLAGEDRNWDISVLWNRDPRMAVPLIEYLRQRDGLQVGDNEPYSGKELAYTINLHAGAGGLANCAVEIRQDHCDSLEEVDRCADLLAEALERVMAHGNLHRVEMF